MHILGLSFLQGIYIVEQFFFFNNQQSKKFVDSVKTFSQLFVRLSLRIMIRKCIWIDKHTHTHTVATKCCT